MLPSTSYLGSLALCRAMYLYFPACNLGSPQQKKQQLTKSLESPKEGTSVCPFFFFPRFKFKLILSVLIFWFLLRMISIPYKTHTIYVYGLFGKCREIPFSWMLWDISTAILPVSPLSSPDSKFPVAQLFEVQILKYSHPRWCSKTTPPTKPVLQPSAYHQRNGAPKTTPRVRKC